MVALLWLAMLVLLGLWVMVPLFLEEVLIAETEGERNDQRELLGARGRGREDSLVELEFPSQIRLESARDMLSRAFQLPFRM